MRLFILVSAIACSILSSTADVSVAQTAPVLKFGFGGAGISAPGQLVAGCEKGEITCREYCAKCNPVSACETSCVRMNNRCVGAICRDRHKKM
jgi:hypothetical protein